MGDKQTASTLPYLNSEIILFLINRHCYCKQKQNWVLELFQEPFFCGRKRTKCSMSKLRKLLLLNIDWITIGHTLCVVFMYQHHKNLNINRRDVKCCMYRSVYSMCDRNHAQNSSDTFFPVDCTHSFYSSKAVFPKLFLLTDPFWLKKQPRILTSLHSICKYSSQMLGTKN
jgi:hypothetical protein